MRRRLNDEYGIPGGWWGAQPRCTAKTGWIVLDAARTPERRAILQVAACRLGLAIVEEVPVSLPEAL
jgi:hypothetical protein